MTIATSGKVMISSETLPLFLLVVNRGKMDARTWSDIHCFDTVVANLVEDIHHGEKRLDDVLPYVYLRRGGSYWIAVKRGIESLTA